MFLALRWKINIPKHWEMEATMLLKSPVKAVEAGLKLTCDGGMNAPEELLPL